MKNFCGAAPRRPLLAAILHGDLIFFRWITLALGVYHATAKFLCTHTHSCTGSADDALWHAQGIAVQEDALSDVLL